eukprot:gene4327-14735_t
MPRLNFLASLELIGGFYDRRLAKNTTPNNHNWLFKYAYQQTPPIGQVLPTINHIGEFIVFSSEPQ